MSNSARRTLVIILIVAVVLLTLLFAARCAKPAPQTPGPAAAPTRAAKSPNAATPSTPPAPVAAPAAEILSAATLDIPAQVVAGTSFRVRWTGPDNPDDYITVVRPDAAPGAYQNYADTRRGNPLDLTAAIEPGNWEVRYVAARSKTILGRAPLVVTPAGVTLNADEAVRQGAPLLIAWTGPNNVGDYITVVPKNFPDARYGNYADTSKGTPLTVTAPMETGAAEIRYVAGQGRHVLARRPLTILTVPVSLEAPDRIPAGSPVRIVWSGPANRGDYLTIVRRDARDGQYGNYTEVAKGSPLTVNAPAEPGPCEIRYMSGQGAKVLGRRALHVAPATP